MITIPLAELREFFKKAKSIKDSRLLPIYAYIKLDCLTKGSATLYKSNGHSFIIHDIEADFKTPTTLLLDEKTLQALVNASKGSDITITTKDTDILLTDGSIKLKFENKEADIKHFQKIERPQDVKKAPLSQEVLEAISAAKSHAKVEKEIKDWMCYVYLKNDKKNGLIFGTNGMIIYSKKIKGTIPEITLELETCSVLAMHTDMEFCRVDNYNYFDSGKTVYGFIEIEQRPGNFESIIAKLNTDKTFVVNRKQVIDFCDLTVAVNPSNLPGIVDIVDAGKKKMRIKFENNEFRLATEQDFEVKKNGTMTSFLCNPIQLKQLLGTLSYDEVIFNDTMYDADKNQHDYFITSEEDPHYIGAIRQIAMVG